MKDPCPSCGYDDLEMEESVCPQCKAPIGMEAKIRTYKNLPPSEQRIWREQNPNHPVTRLAKASVHAKVNPSSEWMKNQLAQTYPKSTLGWVDEAVWHGPLDVNLDQVQMARRPGGRDMSKVVDIARHIDSGDTEDLEPVVLVMTPDFKGGEGKLKIADGYHRTLGYQHSSRDNIPAYVGIVQETDGPWDKKMHDAKLNKRDE